MPNERVLPDTRLRDLISPRVADSDETLKRELGARIFAALRFGETFAAAEEEQLGSVTRSNLFSST